MRLRDKVTLVTGAASGFGEAMASLFAAEGASVLVVDIDGSAAEEVASTISTLGHTAQAFEADVTKRTAIAAAIEQAEIAFGPLDTLVNNAGIAQANKSMLEVGEADFDRIFEVNVKAIYLAALEAVPRFRRHGGGCILNTSSTAAISPRPGLTWYNASKGAVNTLTKSMAVELAPDNIRVNAVCPVIGETGLLETFMGKPDSPETRAPYIAGIPLGRMSKPIDVARAALYLVSDEAEFITGVTLEVDGGRCV